MLIISTIYAILALSHLNFYSPYDLLDTLLFVFHSVTYIECFVMYYFTMMLFFYRAFGHIAVTTAVSPYFTYVGVWPSNLQFNSFIESVIVNFLLIPDASLIERGFITPIIVY